MVRIVWDEPKRLANLRPQPEGHALDFAQVEPLFDFEGAMVLPSHGDELGRPRFVAIGSMGGRLVTLVFAQLGSEAISLISLRAASRKERQTYGRSRS